MIQVNKIQQKKNLFKFYTLLMIPNADNDNFCIVLFYFIKKNNYHNRKVK